MWLVVIASILKLANCLLEKEKAEFCKDLHCDIEKKRNVCGFRFEGEGVRLKIFESECDLMKFGCTVSEEEAYGLVKLELCLDSSPDIIQFPIQESKNKTDVKVCPDVDCSYPGDNVEVCGIRKFEAGYKIRLFKNKCDLYKLNCELDLQFTVTDWYICNGNAKNEDNLISKYTKTASESEVLDRVGKLKNLIIINSSMLAPGKNINETIDTFFAATHIMNLPIKEVDTNALDGEQTNNGSDYRRSVPIKIIKPAKTFTAWIRRPDIINTDPMHLPLINSCYHKCPTRCPDTYSPVCGSPGIEAAEPSLMFRNHCFMDVAQCKMFWENKSPTAQSAAYIESTFLFCLGDLYGSYVRYMPVIRTLQRMGRLKKARYRNHIKHFRNFYNLLNFKMNARG